MKMLGKWSVEHRVAVNLIMVFLIVQFSLDMISIAVNYPGAAPWNFVPALHVGARECTLFLVDGQVI